MIGLFVFVKQKAPFQLLWALSLTLSILPFPLPLSPFSFLLERTAGCSSLLVAVSQPSKLGLLCIIWREYFFASLFWVYLSLKLPYCLPPHFCFYSSKFPNLLLLLLFLIVSSDGLYLCMHTYADNFEGQRSWIQTLESWGHYKLYRLSNQWLRLNWQHLEGHLNIVLGEGPEFPLWIKSSVVVWMRMGPRAHLLEYLVPS